MELKTSTWERIDLHEIAQIIYNARLTHAQDGGLSVGKIEERFRNFLSENPARIISAYQGADLTGLLILHIKNPTVLDMNPGQLRGAMDRVLGGVGLRRGRRDPVDIRVGDALDFCRVETVYPGKLLRLRAEMKVAGNAWLQFGEIPQETGNSQLSQTACIAPKGIFGLLYWYILPPLHRLIFSGLIRELKKLA